MTMLKTLLALILTCAPIAATANLPPPLPPDPAAVAAAERLVATLPLQEVVVRRRVFTDAAAQALYGFWQRSNPPVPPGLDAEAFRAAVFYAIGNEVDRASGDAIALVAQDLVQDYARIFRADEIDALTALHASSQGRAIAAERVADSQRVQSLFERRVGEIVLPGIDALAAFAADGVRLRARVNARQR